MSSCNLKYPYTACKERRGGGGGVGREGKGREGKGRT